MSVSVYRIKLMFSEKICPICGGYNPYGSDSDDYIFVCRGCDFSIGLENGLKKGVVNTILIAKNDDYKAELKKLVKKSNQCLLGLQKLAERGAKAKKIIDRHRASCHWTFPEKK